MSGHAGNARWLRRLLGLGAAAAMLSVAGPAVADHERSCYFTLEVNPTDASQQNAIYPFTVFNTVQYLTQVNDGRRAIRQHVTGCVETHWNDRNATRPFACQDSGRIDMAQYPFQNMYEQIRQDLCDANRDAVRLPVNVTLFIRGERGCLERDEDVGVDPVAWAVIATSHQLNCPIREGGGWEMSGPQPPANPPLPNTRLPGHDIGAQAVDDWQACWTLCERTDGCAAWTFRAAGTSGPGSAALCLLKDGVGVQVADGCCQSGTR
ncbi:MAG: PAN domain-containing protein [Alphaproteobacteria bacterium]